MCKRQSANGFWISNVVNSAQNILYDSTATAQFSNPLLTGTNWTAIAGAGSVNSGYGGLVDGSTGAISFTNLTATIPASVITNNATGRMVRSDRRLVGRVRRTT